MPHFREPVLCSEHLGVSSVKNPLSNAPIDVVRMIGTNADSTAGINGYQNHFNHWEGPTADAAAPGVGGWIVTSTDGGADAAEAVRVLDSNTHGILQITTNDADGDNTQIQLTGSSFKYTAGKRMWFGIRCKPADADDAEFAFGLILESDTNMINTLPTHGIFWEKAETATQMDFHVRKSGTSTETTSFNGEAMADADFHTYQFYIDEEGTVFGYYDGELKATVTTNIPDDEDLTFAIQVQAGAAAAESCQMDWVYIYQER